VRWYWVSRGALECAVVGLLAALVLTRCCWASRGTECCQWAALAALVTCYWASRGTGVRCYWASRGTRVRFVNGLLAALECAVTGPLAALGAVTGPLAALELTVTGGETTAVVTSCPIAGCCCLYGLTLTSIAQKVFLIQEEWES
jgi:hypothetical protein